MILEEQLEDVNIQHHLRMFTEYLVPVAVGHFSLATRHGNYLMLQ